MKNQVSSFYQDAVASVNAGLRQYMLKVFTHMAVGLGVTGLVAFAFSLSPVLMNAILGSGVFWVLFAVQFGIVIYLSASIQKMTASSAQFWFYAYALFSGISLAPIFVVFTGESIATAFFVSASTFLSMVIYGYTTHKDLTGLGSFLMMGLIGLIISSIVNIFIGSSMFMFLTSIVGVGIFTGLTAWDTQKIKSMYYESNEVDVAEKRAVLGALSLYLDFINLFLYVLRLFGNRRD